MDTPLDGRVALVTGAASGIGRACDLARAGSRGVVSYLEGAAEGGEETVRLIAEAASEARFVACDVTDGADVRRLVEAEAALVTDEGVTDRDMDDVMTHTLLAADPANAPT